MAVSEKRSSARVAPRSETFAIAISSMMAARVSARESTAPVQLASPTVRKRTTRRSTVSPGRGSTKGPMASHKQSHPERCRLLVAVAQHFGEVLARIDVKDRKGELLGGERLQREVKQHR